VKTRARCRAFSGLFLAATLIALTPAFGQSVLGIARLPGTSVPSAGAVSGGGASWSGLTAAELRTALPGLSLLAPPGVAGNSIVQSLARLLAASGAQPAALSAATPAAQADAIRLRAAAEVRTLAATAPAAEAASLPAQILALDGLRASLTDARACWTVVIADGDPELLQRLEEKKSSVESQLAEKKKALVRSMIEESRDWDAPAWHGRTAVYTLPDGNVLAVKFQKRSRGSLLMEQDGMTHAAQAGVAAPVPLDLTRATSPEAVDWLQAMGKKGEFLPYLIPARDATGFFAYLGAKLPSDFEGDRRAAIAAAADRSMRDMIRLAESGLVHESLAPLSHSEAAWSWNYLRWSGLRHGPTSIHSWKKGLSFANLRMSGIADFEHIRALDPAVVGQNLTEWSLLVLSAGAANAVPARATADILWSGFKLHAAARIDPDAYALDLARLRGLLRSATRRFYGFERRSRLLPRWLVAAHNAFIGAFSNRDIDRGEALVLSGAVLQTLVADVVYPYVTALKGRAPGRWSDLNDTEHRTISPSQSAARIFVNLLALVLPFAWAGLFGFLLWTPHPSAALDALAIPILLILGSLVLLLGVSTLRALSGVLKRFAFPTWIRAQEKPGDAERPY